MSKLPPGWIACHIGEVAQVVSGGTPSSKDPSNFSTDDGVPWITPADLSGRDGIFVSRGNRYLSEKGFNACSATIIPKGSVLFSSRAPVGYVAIAANDLTTSQGFKSFVLPQELDNRYVYYYLKYITPIAEAMATGTTFKELSGAVAKRLPFLIAPLNEQQRVADELEALVVRVNACREHLDRVPVILGRFRQAVLAAAASGQLTEDWRTHNAAKMTGLALLERARSMYLDYQVRAKDNAEAYGTQRRRSPRYSPEPVDEHTVAELPSGWAWATGEELVEPGADIVYGILQPGPKLKEGIPYIRGMDIENGRILIDQLMKTSHAIAERYSRSSLANGDVLLGIIRATKVAVVPAELVGANITQGTARFRPSSIIRSKYLAAALEAPSTQKWLHAHYRGIDMPGLNLADVRRVPIPLPPIEEQDAIIGRIEALFECADHLRARYIAAVDDIECLMPTLLAKAFRGALVPQDANDEPASVLLERIQATRAAQPMLVKRQKVGAGVHMTKTTIDSVRELLCQLPGDSFTFDDLREHIASDYDALKAVIFALLSEKTPSLKQVFDAETQTMRFQRMKS